MPSPQAGVITCKGIENYPFISKLFSSKFMLTHMEMMMIIYSCGGMGSWGGIGNGGGGSEPTAAAGDTD